MLAERRSAGPTEAPLVRSSRAGPCGAPFGPASLSAGPLGAWRRPSPSRMKCCSCGGEQSPRLMVRTCRSALPQGVPHLFCGNAPGIVVRNRHETVYCRGVLPEGASHPLRPAFCSRSWTQPLPAGRARGMWRTATGPPTTASTPSASPAGDSFSCDNNFG